MKWFVESFDRLLVELRISQFKFTIFNLPKIWKIFQVSGRFRWKQIVGLLKHLLDIDFSWWRVSVNECLWGFLRFSIFLLTVWLHNEFRHQATWRRQHRSRSFSPREQIVQVSLAEIFSHFTRNSFYLCLVYEADRSQIFASEDKNIN